MQRAKQQTPNANSLETKIDKCSLLQDEKCTLKSINQSIHHFSNSSTNTSVNLESVPNYSADQQCKESKCNQLKDTCKERCKDSRRLGSFSEKEEYNIFTFNGKNELNNNQIESKNDLKNEKIDLVNRWSTSINQTPLSTSSNYSPIYLHPLQNEPIDRTSKENKKQLKLRSNHKYQQASNQNDNQTAIQLHNNLEQNNQISSLPANQMQLHSLTAEQRIASRLKQKSKLQSRLSNDSTSTESSKEDERINKDLPYPEYVRYSFNWLPQDSEWRLLCIKMISNPWFERISMTAILLNCITLGMYHPCADEVCVRPKCRLLQMFDDIIFAFFALEMLIKMAAMGVRGTKGAYLSETWNRLDCLIVISG